MVIDDAAAASFLGALEQTEHAQQAGVFETWKGASTGVSMCGSARARRELDYSTRLVYRGRAPRGVRLRVDSAVGPTHLTPRIAKV